MLRGKQVASWLFYKGYGPSPPSIIELYTVDTGQLERPIANLAAQLYHNFRSLASQYGDCGKPVTSVQMH